ncbi:hypothetical protein PUN28_000546 [Cardiocondyla obscurior]|uniref:Uncharacterized protein n=1 Tax=Cardiocondyla obscurior TaxID=286306 RepID=A0AAW2H0K5_9HYME
MKGTGLPFVSETERLLTNLLVEATGLSIQNESLYANVTRPDYLLYMRISGFQSLFGVIRRDQCEDGVETVCEEASHSDGKPDILRGGGGLGKASCITGATPEIDVAASTGHQRVSLSLSPNSTTPLKLMQIVTGKRYVTAANQRDHPETRESRRSPFDHFWCKRKILDLSSTPDSTNTLQSEFRFGALGTKGSRRKLTKETVRRPGEAAEVSLTIPDAREKSSTYPVLQIALTLCRVNSDFVGQK